MLITEAIVDQLAAELGVGTDALREANLYAQDDVTHFGQPIGDQAWRVPRAWRELVASADVAARRAKVADFNKVLMPLPLALLSSPPIASPPIASPPIASPPIASPPIASPPITSPPIASPPIASPPRRTRGGSAGSACCRPSTASTSPPSS